MSAKLSPRRIADDVLEFSVSTSRDAQMLAAQLRSLNLAEDIVAGLKTVCVRFNPKDLPALEARLVTFDDVNDVPSLMSETIDLNIQYGGEYGPDLPAICAAANLSEQAFIEMHTGRAHTVEMIGFTPGFAYISGLPDTFAVPRLSTPRSRVPAGSVGLSSAYTGVYALAGPGGWPLIGRVRDPLFDPESDDSFRLLPGHRIRFRAV
ncbi:MAG: carboxyltransferase domain-containing protein [Pseudomonadota bacterium]